MKMKTTRWLIATTAVLLACAAAGSSAFADRTFISNYEGILGTSLELKVHAANPAIADRAERVVLAEIARESSILSSWDASSEFSRWTRSHDQPVRVSRELFDVLDLFDRWRVRSNGALDASAQSIIRAWSAAAAGKRLPTDDELAAAVRTVQQRHWTLNGAQQTATHLSDAPLVLASFTKSYIIDRAVGAAMGVTGVRAVVLNIGGDIVARGAVAEAIDIADPKNDAENGTPISEIVVHNRTVATSGDYRRGVDIGGVHYSHIVDPRTGRTAEHVISSTVVAANPTDAGALATAFSILSPAESRTLAASLPGVEYLLIDKDGQRIASPGWTSLEAAARTIAGSPAPAAPIAPTSRGITPAPPAAADGAGSVDPT
jgi:thiamine biosynthesis lipoprotein